MVSDSILLYSCVPPIWALTCIFPLFTRKWVPEVKMSRGQNLVIIPQSGETYRHRELRLLNRMLTIVAYLHRMLTKPATLLMVGKPQWCKMPKKIEYGNWLWVLSGWIPFFEQNILFWIHLFWRCRSNITNNFWEPQTSYLHHRVASCEKPTMKLVHINKLHYFPYPCIRGIFTLM